MDQTPTPKRFFSIIVPAYNEELIIEDTIKSLQGLQYPKERYEVIVVDNASTDETYGKAKQYESENTSIHRLDKKGVSLARNFGIAQRTEHSDWAIFLDADTVLAEYFLEELNGYLERNPARNYGTTTVRLDDETLVGKFWTWYLNISDRMIGVLHRIHIVHKDLLAEAAYDESLVATEDLKFSRLLKAKGGVYFFMSTRAVITSARRFKRKGYMRMLMVNIGYGLLPYSVIKKMDWELIR